MEFLLKRSVPLSDYSTFGIGGKAKFFVEVSTIREMQEVRRYVEEHALPFVVIGRGSNVLFDDRGFDGLVILNKIDFVQLKQEEVYVGAGYSFSLLGVQTAREGWSGLEFASGIPGSVGGGVFMNAGAKGSDTWSSLLSVGFVTPEGIYQERNREGFSYGYRFSSFQENTLIIVSATFALTKSEEAGQKQRAFLKERVKTQPYKEKNAGCIFKNPLGFSAGALIDRCGLKGFSIGGAEISTLHANFINNRGFATAREVLLLIEHVKGVVKDKTGQELTLEIRKIPYQGDA